MNYENSRTTDTPASRRPVWRGCMAATAAFLVAGTVGLNASPAFAEEISKVPVIGQLAQVLTFRSFHGMENDVELNVDVPVIQGKTDGELPAKVNAQIQKIVSDYETQAKAGFCEYKDTFFATGGTEEEWADRTLNLFIDYDVKYFEDDILSLELITAKTWVSAEEEHHFYNIDLTNDTEVTLEDILGADYVNICNDAIVTEINARLAANENAAFFGFGDDEGMMDGFVTVTEETPFYLNADGNVVLSFPEYSIAPGYMGIQEFMIQP